MRFLYRLAFFIFIFVVSVLMTVSMNKSRNMYEGGGHINTLAENDKFHSSGMRQALPHLISRSDNDLKPTLILGKGLTQKQILMSIPVVEREKDSYILTTLKSITKWMDAEDRKNASIVVFLCGTPSSKFVEKTISDIKDSFSKEVVNVKITFFHVRGIIYPTDFSDLKPTFNDDQQRVIWRTKQNIDYMYIMSYLSRYADYYLQLEDDIRAAKWFLKNVLFSLESNQDTEWTILEFSALGFIGKLFRSSDVAKLAHLISVFYKDKPVDWILIDFLRGKYCDPDWNISKCMEETRKRRILYDPAQFQHIGLQSSLKGKVQKLSESTFDGLNNMRNKSNPEAIISTIIPPNRSLTIEDVYYKSAFYFGEAPRKGDFINIAFKDPLMIKRVLITSGKYDHPLEQFGPETVLSASNDGEHQQIGTFDENGRLSLRFDCRIADALRLKVTKDLEHAIIIDQIVILAC